MKAPELPVRTTSSDTPGEKNPALTRQLAMVRALLAEYAGDAAVAQPEVQPRVSGRAEITLKVHGRLNHFGQEFGDVQYIYEANEYQLEQKYLVNPADPAKANEFLSHRIPPGFGPGKLPH